MKIQQGISITIACTPGDAAIIDPYKISYVWLENVDELFDT